MCLSPPGDNYNNKHLNGALKRTQRPSTINFPKNVKMEEREMDHKAGTRPRDSKDAHVREATSIREVAVECSASTLKLPDENANLPIYRDCRHKTDYRAVSFES